jgi:hypothetical protein
MPALSGPTLASAPAGWGRLAADASGGLDMKGARASFAASLGGLRYKLSGSILSRKMPYREFNPAVGKLSPFLDDCCETAVWRAVDNLAGFPASGLKGQRDSQRVPFSDSVCQITGTKEHVGTPTLVNADGADHSIVEVERGQLIRPFFPRFPRDDRSTNGACYWTSVEQPLTRLLAEVRPLVISN